MGWRVCGSVTPCAPIRAIWGNAEDRRKDKQGGRIIYFRWPNSNIVAQAAATAALEDTAFLERTIAHNRIQRQRMRRVLVENGVAVADSAANFFFIDCAGNSESVAGKLLAEGVIVKPWTTPGFENWMRVTIGSESDNDRFLALFLKIAAAR